MKAKGKALQVVGGPALDDHTSPESNPPNRYDVFEIVPLSPHSGLESESSVDSPIPMCSPQSSIPRDHGTTRDAGCNGMISANNGPYLDKARRRLLERMKILNPQLGDGPPTPWDDLSKEDRKRAYQELYGITEAPLLPAHVARLKSRHTCVDGSSDATNGINGVVGASHEGNQARSNGAAPNNKSDIVQENDELHTASTAIPHTEVIAGPGNQSTTATGNARTNDPHQQPYNGLFNSLFNGVFSSPGPESSLFVGNATMSNELSAPTLTHKSSCQWGSRCKCMAINCTTQCADGWATDLPIRAEDSQSWKPSGAQFTTLLCTEPSLSVGHELYCKTSSRSQLLSRSHEVNAMPVLSQQESVVDSRKPLDRLLDAIEKSRDAFLEAIIEFYARSHSPTQDRSEMAGHTVRGSEPGEGNVPRGFLQLQDFFHDNYEELKLAILHVVEKYQKAALEKLHKKEDLLDEASYNMGPRAGSEILCPSTKNIQDYSGSDASESNDVFDGDILGAWFDDIVQEAHVKNPNMLRKVEGLIGTCTYANWSDIPYEKRKLLSHVVIDVLERSLTEPKDLEEWDSDWKDVRWSGNAGKKEIEAAKSNDSVSRHQSLGLNTCDKVGQQAFFTASVTNGNKLPKAASDLYTHPPDHGLLNFAGKGNDLVKILTEDHDMGPVADNTNAVYLEHTSIPMPASESSEPSKKVSSGDAGELEHTHSLEAIPDYHILDQKTSELYESPSISDGCEHASRSERHTTLRGNSTDLTSSNEEMVGIPTSYTRPENDKLRATLDKQDPARKVHPYDLNQANLATIEQALSEHENNKIETETTHNLPSVTTMPSPGPEDFVLSTHCGNAFSRLSPQSSIRSSTFRSQSDKSKCGMQLEKPLNALPFEPILVEIKSDGVEDEKQVEDLLSFLCSLHVPRDDILGCTPLVPLAEEKNDNKRVVEVTSTCESSPRARKKGDGFVSCNGTATPVHTPPTLTASEDLLHTPSRRSGSTKKCYKKRCDGCLKPATRSPGQKA